MIRSFAFTRAADGKTCLLQIILDRDGLEYRELTRAEMLHHASRLIQMLTEDERE